MPVDPATAGAIVNAGGQGLNAIIGVGSNLLQRHWNQKDYKQQRKDALSDWHMQNEYNSPKEQMARLKAAGLNPHLVYGNGADAQMGAPMRDSNLKETHFKAPEFDAGSVLGSYNAIKMTNAQVDNLESVMETQQAQRALLKAQELNTLMSTKTQGLDYETKSQLQQYQLDAAKIGNQKMEAELSNQLIKNHIDSFTANFMQRTQEERIQNVTADLIQKNLGIKLTKEQLKLIDQDQALKDIEIGIRRKGGNPNDPAYQKYIVAIIVALVKKMGYDMSELLK